MIVKNDHKREKHFIGVCIGSFVNKGKHSDLEYVFSIGIL